jgi:galactokinase
MPKFSTAFAPGRVEVLGNHTDYNLGFVLSAAIHLGVTVEAERLNGEDVEVSSLTTGRPVRSPLNALIRRSEDSWANYPIGVISTFMEAGYRVGGLRLGISSDLPLGAGLSSSAALEVATALAVQSLFDLDIGPMQLAQLCQRAENDFVGVKCGLLDHASSAFGREDHLILIDFREITINTVPMPPKVALLLLNSGVPHELTGGEYNERRKQCAEAATGLHVASLREATPEMVRQSNLPDEVRRRALHITEENERVIQGVAALRNQQIDRFGQLMYASHQSSSVNFENSTHNIDILVNSMKEIPGVYGSRITGGGFGGSTVSLIDPDQAETIIETITKVYQHETGATCSAFLTKPSEGARIIDSSNSQPAPSKNR